MANRNWVLAGMLVALPAIAEDVAFEGHTLEVDASREARPIMGMRGTRYSIPGSASQIVGRVQYCAAQQPAAITIESVDAEAGRLVAGSRAAYRQKGRRSVRARMTVETGEGNFLVVFTDLATASADTGGFAPLIQQDGAGWESALEAVIGIEQPLLDCMFR
ncbi:hypothetical protein [Thermomonas carbonis]|uniref:SRPBCC family protein n=1 Tax=Thermomonas carbonis TaxID=1463158 RepID=A0A7G9SLS9_9GAMM|nr:hypothetical protein [Thermomonas carbonis]QNN68804.1 hypothetical protein H9L16_08605 [Thermomonas carbonis]